MHKGAKVSKAPISPVLSKGDSPLHQALNLLLERRTQLDTAIIALRKLCESE